MYGMLLTGPIIIVPPDLVYGSVAWHSNPKSCCYNHWIVCIRLDCCALVAAGMPRNGFEECTQQLRGLFILFPELFSSIETIHQERLSSRRLFSLWCTRRWGMRQHVEGLQLKKWVSVSGFACLIDN